MFAIKNTKTNKWVSGTNFRRFPSYQLTSSEQALTWEHEGDAKMEFRRRRCGNDYEIVEVKLTEV